MKRAWPWLLLAVAGLLLLIVWYSERAAEPEPPSVAAVAGLSTVRDPEGRVELPLPKGWTPSWAGPAQPGSTEVLHARPPGDEGVEVRVFWSRVPIVDLTSLYTKAIQMASRREERVVDGRRATQGGGVVVELETRSPMVGKPERASLVRFLARGGQLLQVRASAPMERFAELEATLRAVVAGAVLP